MSVNQVLLIAVDADGSPFVDSVVDELIKVLRDRYGLQVRDHSSGELDGELKLCCGTMPLRIVWGSDPNADYQVICESTGRVGQDFSLRNGQLLISPSTRCLLPGDYRRRLLSGIVGQFSQRLVKDARTRLRTAGAALPVQPVHA